ncbi:MAG: hypothetical protein AB7S81_06240 [Bdellovibrionales bacterium]
MTDNFDEFEPGQFDEMEIDEGSGTSVSKKDQIRNMLNKPVVKLGLIVGVVGLAIAGALGAFTDETSGVESARMVTPPSMQEAPGGDVTPFFAEQNKMANENRVQEAIENQGSAMPTPIGKNISGLDIDELARKQAMEEFNAQTERLKREWQAEQKRNEEKMQSLQQQMQQQAVRPADDTLAQAMQQQMQTLMTSWSPKGIKVVAGVPQVETATQGSEVKSAQGMNNAVVASKDVIEPKVLVPAGTVNYAQLLIEANSDVPGPIMVQILSGPLRGARAIGQFKVMYENLTLSFNLVSYKGKEYRINAIALDPETTLGGMATEVDHRYFKRIVLPAAAEFVSSFGDALSSAGSQTTASGDTVVITEVKKGYKEAAFEGMAEAGNAISRFLDREAARTETLVRVAAGTAMGMFFLESVTDDTLPTAALPAVGGSDLETGAAAMAKAYQSQGYGAPTVSNYPSSVQQSGATEYQRPGIKTPGGTTTIY